MSTHTQHKKARPTKRSIKEDYMFEACGTMYKRRRKHASRVACADGPAAPKDVPKRKNAVDRFWNEHQEEYETRGKSSSHRLRDVEQHNATHPQMKEVILKRRSDGKPTRAARRRFNPADLCTHCRRLTALEAVTRRGLPRISSKQRRTRNNGTRKKTLRKKAARLLRRRPKTRKNVLTVYRKPYFASNSTMYSLDSMPQQNVDRERQDVCYVESNHSKTSQMRREPPRSSKGSVVSQMVSVDRNASVVSMSSYHSYGSMGQPPVV